MISYLLQENTSLLFLEDLSGYLVLEGSPVVQGGDDAPRAMEIRGRKKKRKRDLETIFEQIESTVRSVLPKMQPETEPAPSIEPDVAAITPPLLDTEKARRDIAELVSLAEGQHAILQRASKLRELVQAYETAQQRQRDRQQQEAWERMLAEEEELLLLA